MPGAVSYGRHEGSRSEPLAHAVFSAFGTAVPVPYAEDVGLDFYCTLMERQHPVLVPIAYYAVQVKSELRPWVFARPREVRWLVHCPLPILLVIVTKSEARIRIYHTFPRFYAWAHPPLPSRLELIPEDGTEGGHTQWTEDNRFKLGPPILDFPSSRVDTDSDFRATAAGILKSWLNAEGSNLSMVRQNIRSFSMPARYETNVLPNGGRVVQGLAKVERSDLGEAIRHLKEPLDSIARHLVEHNEVPAGARALLLLRQLYRDDVDGPLALDRHAWTMNRSLGRSKPRYLYEAIDELGSLIDSRLLETPNATSIFATVTRLSLIGDSITDQRIALLKDAPNLLELDLSDSRITDAGLVVLEHLRHLKHLLLAGTDITDASLRHVSKLVRLRLLRLTDTNITSAGIRRLRGLQHLEILYLEGTRLGDTGLRHISELPRLAILTLNRTKISDAGIKHLREAKALRHLDLRDTRASNGAVTRLREALPRVAIEPPR